MLISKYVFGPYFSKNDSTNTRALKNKLFFKSFGKFSDKNYVLGVPLLQNFRSIDYSL